MQLTKNVCRITMYYKGADMMAISLRLSDEETTLIKKYAELNGLSVSELIRQSVLERIEDEYDLKAYDEALAEYLADPVTYTHAEVIKMLEKGE